MGSAAFLTPVFLFGSIRGGSGKSSIVAHLAVYLQSRGRKVAVIDANAAFPQQLRATFPRAVTLETYADLVELATEGTSRFRRTFFFTPTERISFFPAFRLGDPVRLLTDTSLRDFFLQLRSQFDVVLINLAPGGDAFVAAESFLQRRGGEAGSPAGVLITTTDARSLLLLDALLRSRSALPHLARERLLFVYNRLPRGVEDATVDGPRLGWNETKQVFRLPISLGLTVMDDLAAQSLEAAPILHRESSALRQAMATLARTLSEVAEGQWQTDQAAGDPHELAPCLDPQLLERLGKHVEPLQRRLMRRLFAPGMSVAGFIESGPSAYRIRLRLSGTGRRVFPPLLGIGYPPPAAVTGGRTPTSFARPPFDAPPPARLLDRCRPPSIQVKPQYQFDDRFASSLGPEICSKNYYIYSDSMSEPVPEWRGYLASVDIPTLDQMLGYRKRPRLPHGFAERPDDASPQSRPAHIPTEFLVSVVMNGHDTPFWRWEPAALRQPAAGGSRAGEFRPVDVPPVAEIEAFSSGFRPIDPPVVEFREIRHWPFSDRHGLRHPEATSRHPVWRFTSRFPDAFPARLPEKVRGAELLRRDPSAPVIETVFGRTLLHLRHPALPAGYRFALVFPPPLRNPWPPHAEPATDPSGICRMRPAGILFPDASARESAFTISSPTPAHIIRPAITLRFPAAIPLHIDCSELLDTLVLPSGVSLGRPSFRSEHRLAAYLEPTPLQLPPKFGMAPVLISHHLPGIRWGTLPYHTALPPAPAAELIGSFAFTPSRPPAASPHDPVVPAPPIPMRKTSPFSVKLRPFSQSLRLLPFPQLVSQAMPVRSVFPSAWLAGSIDIYLGVHRHHAEPFVPTFPSDNDLLRLLKLPSLALRRRDFPVWSQAWLPNSLFLSSTVRPSAPARSTFRHLFEPDNQFPLPGYGVRRSIGAFITFDPGILRPPAPVDVGMARSEPPSGDFALLGYQLLEAWFHDIPRPYRFLTSFPLYLQLHGDIQPHAPAHDWPFLQTRSPGAGLPGHRIGLPPAPPYYSLFHRIDIDTRRSHLDLDSGEICRPSLPLPHESFPGLTLHDRRHLELRQGSSTARFPLRHRVYLPEVLAGRGTFGFPKLTGIDLLFSHLAVLCRQHLSGPITFGEPSHRGGSRLWKDRLLLEAPLPPATAHLQGTAMTGVPGRIRQNFQRKQALKYTRVQDLREAVRLTQASLSRLAPLEPS
ncbi:MAG TPA: division plane positioning ATPase MipZ [Candidatus Ozemobacteraceae bacterium]|nr:division plane positioning ATPase MipZ [Candidatus Ozemobacteraceae bacterium]